MGAQEEELCHLRGLLTRGQAQGLGLLRLEYLCYQDPGLDEAGLAQRLTQVLTWCDRWPVALRLADWSPQKPPPARSALAQGWRGARGPAGWCDTEGLSRQLGAIASAVAQAAHPQVRVLAPMVEAPAPLLAVQEQADGLGLGELGVMLESAAGLEHLERWISSGRDLWLGLGDLSQDAARVPQRRWRLLGRSLRQDAGRWWVCGQDQGRCQRLISGTLM